MHAFFEIWHCIWALLGCSFNLMLIYMAIYKSPKTIRSYATLIINFAVTDFFECALDLFIQIRLMPAPGDVTVIYILNGSCKYISQFACKIGLSLFLPCITHSVWSLLLSFGYRYYILHYSALTRLKLVKIVLLILIPSLFQGLTFWTSFAPLEIILPLAKKWFPQYNFEAETGVLTGIVDITHWAATYAVFNICLPIFPIYIAIFILRQKIITFLGAKTQSMSPDTKAAHSQLLKALTIQAFIPIFMGIGVIFYLIAQSGLIVSPIVENAIFSIAILMPALSPLTYFYFVRPYRQFLKRIFKNPFKVSAAYVQRTGSSSAMFQSGGHPSQIGTQATTVL